MDAAQGSPMVTMMYLESTPILYKTWLVIQIRNEYIFCLLYTFHVKKLSKNNFQFLRLCIFVF